jgi:hypothetical protein
MEKENCSQASNRPQKTEVPVPPQVQNLSDTGLMDRIQDAVNKRHEKELVMMLKPGQGRSHRVFLQFLPHRDWKPFLRKEGDGGDLKWMYYALMNAGNEKLAQHVAMTMKDTQCAADLLLKT